MAFGKKNVVKLDPLAYSLCILGEAKVGKSTLVKEYCEKVAGEDSYLFLECGQERGADAIEGINYVNCPEWNYDYDEYTNSVGFADVINDIVENKETEYPNLKVVVIDTYDQLITLAEKESIRLYNKECREKGQMDKVTKTINSAWGGFGRGERKAIDLMFDARAELLKVNVQVIWIGHVKTKEITDVVSGQTYQTLTSDQQQNYFNALKKNLHFLALAYVDRDIVTEKQKNKIGQTTTVHKLKNETRKIKFRDDNYAVDSGSRFANIVPEISMDVDEFIKAITDAITAEANKGSVSLEDRKKSEKIAEEAKEKEIAEKEIERHAKNDSIAELEAAKEKIKEFCMEHKGDKAVLAPMIKKAKELGIKPLEVSNIDEANAILEFCN